MVAIPILHQIFIDALSRMNVNIDLDAFDKWREKNKYDGEKYEILKFDEESILPYEGEPEDYIKVIQEFCIWMNEKPSRNLTLLVFADDEINSVKTSFAMGDTHDFSIMLSKEFADNWGFCEFVESSIYAFDRGATFDEFKEWKKSLKK